MPNDEVIYLDNDLANADWTKQSWDLERDPAYWQNVPMAELETLVRLPAYKAAPPPVRKVIEARLAAVR